MKDSKFLVRTISGAVVLLVMIVAIVLGGRVLAGILTTLSLLGLYEFYKVNKCHFSVPAFAGYAGCVLLFLITLLGNYKMTSSVIVCVVIVVLILYVIRFGKVDSEQVAMILFGFLYVPLLFSFVLRIRLMPDGIYYVWLVFTGAWGSDTCAYLVGTAMGKHKITPVLSPKKSVEGCIGGVIGAALVSFMYALYAKRFMIARFDVLIVFPIIGAITSIVAQFGDLAASAIKRNNNIKDFSNLIPGHGGILDRFDSIIVAAPVVYVLCKLFQIAVI